MTDSLARQVLLTLAYTDQFQYPLTKEEIKQRLLSPTPGDIDQVLQNLRKKKLIDTTGGYFFLKGKKNHVHTREQRWQFSQAKQPSVQKFINIARKIPWIKGVAITGSLAMSNATAESDIDFLIVTDQHRLWLTRFLVLIITLVVGKRRTADYEKPNSWCFNLWLDTNHLTLPKDKQNVYTAYEVCQARWVLTHDVIQHRFYYANRWVARFMPSYLREQQASIIGPTLSQQWTPSMLRWKIPTGTSFLLSLADYVLFIAQRLYMAPHMTRESVGYGYAFFHPRDTKQLVYTRWHHAIRQSR